MTIVVEVREAFLHCTKALRRARLWQTDSIQDRRQMPSLASMDKKQVTGKPVESKEHSELERDLEEEYRSTMY